MISIVIPVYNAEKYIENCVKRIIAQKDIEFELILIDDGSKDNSLKICQEIAKQDNRIQVYTQSNMGVSEARNHGVRKSKGDYIYFMDADDFLVENALKIITECLQKEEIDLFMFDYKKIRSEKEIENNISIQELHKENRETALEKMVVGNVGGFVWNKIYKRTIIEENDLIFDTKLNICEDLDFNIRYIMLCHKIASIDAKLYMYYQSNDSSYNKKDNMKWFSIKELIPKIESYETNTEISKKVIENLKYEMLYSSCLAIAKNNANSIKYDDIEVFRQYIKNNKKTIWKSKVIAINRKWKLFLFIVFPNIIYKIKTKK